MLPVANKSMLLSPRLFEKILVFASPFQYVYLTTEVETIRGPPDLPMCEADSAAAMDLGLQIRKFHEVAMHRRHRYLIKESRLSTLIRADQKKLPRNNIYNSRHMTHDQNSIKFIHRNAIILYIMAL